VSAIFEALKLEIRRSPLSIYTIAHRPGSMTSPSDTGCQVELATHGETRSVARAIGKRLESLGWTLRPHGALEMTMVPVF
jgi:hypothetical protein